MEDQDNREPVAEAEAEQAGAARGVLGAFAEEVDDEDERTHPHDDDMCRVVLRCYRILQKHQEGKAYPVPLLRDLVRHHPGNNGGALWWHPCRACRPYGAVVVEEFDAEIECLADALFYCLSTEQLLSFFRPLVRENSDILLSQDRHGGEIDGSTLLHLALGPHWIRDTLLVQLLSTNPAVARLQTYSGRTPIHDACDRFVGDADATVTYLLELDPTALRIPDEAGYLPLHLAFCNHCLSRDTIQRLVDAYPEGLSHRDELGVYPLWLCFFHHLRSQEVLRDPLWQELVVHIVALAPSALRAILPWHHSPLLLLCFARAPPESVGIVRLVIREWPVALGLISNVSVDADAVDDRNVSDGSLPLEVLVEFDGAPNVPPYLVSLVERATQRLLLSLVELVLHETFCDGAAVFTLQRDLRSVLDAYFPAADVASSSTSSLALARSLRSLGCPGDLCCRAFRLKSVQQLLLNSEAVCEALCTMHRLYKWEDETLPPPDPSSHKAQLGALEVVTDCLDGLFLRLRESPALFPSAVASKGGTEVL